MFHCNQPKNEWEKDDIPPFDELLISWNGKRPETGTVHIYVAVKTKQWSPWLLYASWGSEGQESVDVKAGSISIYQDTLEVKGEKATGFRVKVTSDLDALHVYTNGQQPKKEHSSYPSLHLPVKGISQLCLNHPRHRDLCSPTATTAVIRYLIGAHLDPVSFCHQVLDQKFDIFGNWVLNVAQASHILGPGWRVWVERLGGFGDIYQRLAKGTPVVVSVRSPLPGSAFTYPSGHLIAVVGYNGEAQKVLCIDSAFPTDEETMVSYDLADFMAAWGRRAKIAYIFERQ